MNKAEVVIFVHIPKTAGTTLFSIVASQYPAGSVLPAYFDPEEYSRMINDPSLLEETPSGAPVRWIHGHIPFGFHSYITKKATYVTMLRNPVDQVISHYHYIRRSKSHPWHTLTNQLSLEQFLNHPLTCTACTNPQTWQLSGTASPDLSTAKYNLDHYFSVVGTTEKFDESLFLMKKEFSWNEVTYQKMNVAPNRSLQEEYSDSVMEQLRASTALDYQLYQYADAHLGEALQRLPPVDQMELNTFLQQLSGE